MAATPVRSARKTARAANQGAQSTPTQPIERPESLWERISRKAYALWEERGRQEGRDLDNWLDAEAIVMEVLHDARE